jgi:hypothetical protein
VAHAELFDGYEDDQFSQADLTAATRIVFSPFSESIDGGAGQPSRRGFESGRGSSRIGPCPIPLLPSIR